MTLEQYLITKHFETGDMNSPVFETMVRVWGREKILNFYTNWKKGNPPLNPFVVSEPYESMLPTVRYSQRSKHPSSFVDKSYKD